MQKNRNTLILSVIVSALLGFYTHSYISWMSVNQKNILSDLSTTTLSGKDTVFSSEQNSALSSLYRTLQKEHVDEKKTTSTALFEGAMRGMAESVQDKHTQFLNNTETETFNSAIRQNFEGIGAIV
jgi:C-terminal processing protease CtpA/Prc